MKGKSWQRFSVAVLMILGYFAVIVLAYNRNDLETIKVMVAALPPMIVAVTSVWVHQAGSESTKKNGGSG